MLVVCAIVAVRQAPRDDPFAPAGTRVDWWLHPIDKNAMFRVPWLHGDFADICVLPGTKHIWVAGQGMQIFHSADGGATWESLDVLGSIPAADSPAVVEMPHSVIFTTPSIGWVISEDATVYGTRDGGRSWSIRFRNPGSFLPLHDAQFIGNRGWLATSGGLVTTTDGGQKWTRVADGDISSVFFLPDGSGWYATSEGQIFRVSDDGRHDPLANIRSAAFELRFVDPRHGSLRTETDLRLTDDGGASWKVSTRLGVKWAATPRDAIEIFRDRNSILWSRSATGKLNVVRFAIGGEPAKIAALDASSAIALFRDGTLLGTRDGGESWHRLTYGADMQDIASDATGTHLLCVGGAGTVLVSDDGGATWESRPVDSHVKVVYATVVSGEDAWIEAEETRVGRVWLLHSVDGGETWTRVGPLRPDGAGRLYASGDRLLVVRSDSADRSNDGGRTWRAVFTAKDAIAAQFVDEQHGWRVQRTDNMLELTNDGGATWRPVHHFGDDIEGLYASSDMKRIIAGGADANLSTIHLYRSDNIGDTWRGLPLTRLALASDFAFAPDLLRGWIEVESGLMDTFDGGVSWSRSRASAPLPAVRTIKFSDDGKHLIARSEFGIPLRGEDDGNLWRAPEPARYPAPWFWAVVVLLVPLLFLSTRSQPAVVVEDVGEVPVNDAPLTRELDDVLQFAPTANGVTRFLANENTKPPLTIAITGKWGKGKSSLMNLVLDGVRRYGHRPVLFNAWHYQSEEHLLVAVMESIRREAVPKWWRVEQLTFRLRLLIIRGVNNWLPAVMAATALAGGIAYFVRDPARFEHAVSLLGKMVHGSFTEVGAKEALSGSLLAAMIAGAAATLRALNTFGVSSSRIAAFLTGAVQMKNIGGEAGFRHQFATAFHEVTRALGRRRIVLAIDDLDRCRPDHVLNILETINFLVSCGDCFIITGMDRDRVERCVSMKFEEEAKKLGDDIDGDGVPDMTPVQYARLYLEKLINLEVAVPEPRKERSQLLFAGQEETEARRIRLTANGQRVAERVRLAVAAGLMLAFIGGGAWLSYSKLPAVDMAVRTPAALQAAVIPATATALVNQTQSDTSTTTKSKSPQSPVSRHLASAAPLPAADDAGTSSLLMWLAVSALVILAVVLTFFERESGPTDSKPFRQALKVWHELLFEAGETPRAMKRCVNRVRYYAMRQRSNPLPERFIDRLIRFASGGGWRAARPDRQPLQINDERLVALGVIQHVHPGWLGQDEFWSDPLSFTRDKLPAALSLRLGRTSIEMLRPEFERIAAGVRVIHETTAAAD